MNQPLTAAQEASLLRELHAACVHFNHTYFKGTLKPVQLSLSDHHSFLARYHAATRSIEFSRPFLHTHPWGSILEVLKHELAHQFVVEVLRETEPPHGPAFRAICERLGIDASARGVPEEKLSPEAARVLERVQKLLALAQSDNRHEAEAAAAAAQRLILRHNLERATQPTAHETYTYRHLGRVTSRIREWERRLGNILSDHFFVNVIWVPAYRLQEQKRGSVLEAIGSQENLEIASYVYDFLAHSAAQLWHIHQKSTGIRSNAERLTYYAGVMSGFAQKLALEQQKHRTQGLVWVPHAALNEYTRKRHPSLRTIKYAGQRRTSAFAEGQKAGRSVHLHRGVTQGSSSNLRLLKS